MSQHHFHSPTNTGDRIQRYDNWEAVNYGSRARKAAENYSNYRKWNGTRAVQFGIETGEVDDSLICSPPLWKTSPPRSPQNRPNHYRSLSPVSKAQAIARGQRELMDMVKNMPESSYELSLKDLVEKPRVEDPQVSKEEDKSFNEEIPLRREGSYREIPYRREVSSKKKSESRGGHGGRRSGNIDNGGFYLKMAFPASLGSNKKKKNEGALTNYSAKISPRPSISDGSIKGRYEKEWWKKNLRGSADSESGSSSINSGSMKSTGGSSTDSSNSRSSSRRESGGGGGGCLAFICKSKRV